MDPMISKARAELRAISMKLQELNDRKGALEKFLAIYAELADKAEEEAVPSVSASTPVKTRIISAALELLGNGAHMHTRELLDELSAIGINVNGKDRVQALSAILSQDPAKRFLPDRRFGWSLKVTNPEAVPLAPEAPPPAPTGDGFDD